ncbi:MAG: hypothetical protein ABIJ21_08775 [Nanoarchaeota archaeon]
MVIRDVKGRVEDKIPVQTVLVSVFDKSGLEEFIPALLEMSPAVYFLSTGGTYKKIKEILGERHNSHLEEVADYTGFPEMEGGLVKTLHPKIHAGILGERNNPNHQFYLSETLEGVYIDMVVVNLYPFQSVISSPDVTFEKARGHIDIGGPAMLRAAAKNFPSCAAVCDPRDYGAIIGEMRENGGATSLKQRLYLARKVFDATNLYDGVIAGFLAQEIAERSEELLQQYLGDGNE